MTHLFVTSPIANSDSPGPRAEFAAVWSEDAVGSAVFCGLLAGIAWAPFWLGGNRVFAWGVNGILFPGLTLMFELSLLARGRRHAIGLKRLAIPAGLFAIVVVWIGAQLSSFAPSIVAHPIWSMAGDALGQQLNGAISVNPGLSALSLMRLLTDASVLWLTMQLCRNATRALLLFRAVAAIVAVYSAYGLILAAVFAGAIPLFDAPDVGGFVRSTFVNRNNFATYAGLGLIATVALLLRLYRHETPDQEGLGAFRLSRLIETTGREGRFLIGGGVVILVALLGTVSRGGIISAALGVFALFALTFAGRRRQGRQQIEAILFVTVALVAGFLFFGDRIVGRIASSGLGDAGRMAVYLIVGSAILDSPYLGFGYGTFADVFPMYRDQSIPVSDVWDKAHNTYLEVWQGLGLVFGTALMAALGLLVYQCLNGAVRRRRNVTAAIGAAGAALLVAVHAMVDFSLQLEGVTLTFMALLGAGVAQSLSSRVVISD